jgi:hypothetical protein
MKFSTTWHRFSYLHEQALRLVRPSHDVLLCADDMGACERIFALDPHLAPCFSQRREKRGGVHARAPFAMADPDCAPFAELQHEIQLPRHERKSP